MRALKIIGLILVGMIAILLIAGLFIDGNYALEREVTINKPRQEVFDYVKFLKNQNNFSVWAMADPGMKQEFTGEDGTIGCSSSWESENPDVGQGKQTIVQMAEGQRIDYEFHFIEPFESTDYAYMTTEAVSDNQTIVKWGFRGEMKYPMNLMMLTMDLEKMLAPDLEKGLGKLKTILEQ